MQRGISYHLVNRSSHIYSYRSTFHSYLVSFNAQTVGTIIFWLNHNFFEKNYGKLKTWKFISFVPYSNQSLNWARLLIFFISYCDNLILLLLFIKALGMNSYTYVYDYQITTMSISGKQIYVIQSWKQRLRYYFYVNNFYNNRVMLVWIILST